MDPTSAAQYGIAAFALGVLGYAVATLVHKRNGGSDVKRFLERLSDSQERLAVALERQTTLLEQQGHMLERVSDRVDEVWRNAREAR